MSDIDPGRLAMVDQTMAEVISKLALSINTYNQHRASCEHTTAEMWATTLAETEELATDIGMDDAWPKLCLMLTGAVSALADLVRSGTVAPDLSPDVRQLMILPAHVEMAKPSVWRLVAILRGSIEDPEMEEDDIADVASTTAGAANDSWTRNEMAASLAAALMIIAKQETAPRGN